VIDATIVQRSYFYGYLNTYILYSMAVTSPQMTMQAIAPWIQDGTVDTGADLVTPDNLDAYANYQIQCLGIPSL